MDYMELTALQITKTKANQFLKKGIDSVEALLRFLPKMYYDFRIPMSLDDYKEKAVMVITGEVIWVTVYAKCIRATVKDAKSGKILTVTWFHVAPYKVKQLEGLHNKTVICAGVISKSFSTGAYEMTEPSIFSDDLKKYGRIYPVYPKIAGMSVDYLTEKIALALDTIAKDCYLDEADRQYFDVVSEQELYRMIHMPDTLDEIKQAKKRLVIETLYHFASELHKEAGAFADTSPFVVTDLKKTMTLLDTLPYTLTEDQQAVFTALITQAKTGKHINSFIQGDVGCGKTILAILMMFAMAENGYQAVLTAPTDVLARQHFHELSIYAEQFGFRIAFLGKQKDSEKRKMLQGIKDGEYQFIVGTHAVFSESVEYQNLGIAICDEEHRFGVLQRERLVNTHEGLHHITMSATPIPRTLAKSVFGEYIDVFTIHTMPNGRKPVKTCITDKEESVFAFMKEQMDMGHQCYIVCPLKEEGEMDALSVEEVYERVKKAFPSDIRAAVLTGGMDKNETDVILQDFAENRIQILIATTVVEVGVNVPNASVITIWNAERFGLATLHQLRGRVGRGDAQSYCILKSGDSENPRLLAMKETTDGFVIAQRDLEIRGAGDFIGTMQSGDTKEVMLMLKYPALFERIQEYVKAK